MPGVLLGGGIEGKEGLLGIEDLFDPGAKLRPGFLGEVEIRSQVEQGVLAELSADSPGPGGAVGETGAAGAAGSRLGLANEHEPEDYQALDATPGPNKNYGTTFAFLETKTHIT